MTAIEPPTLGEVIRRIQDATAAISSLADEMRKDRRDNEQRFVPRGEYEERRKAVDRRQDEVEKELDIQAGFRRQVQAALIVGFILLLIPIVGTVATFARSST